jgi:hypothetical protein
MTPLASGELRIAPDTQEILLRAYENDPSTFVNMAFARSLRVIGDNAFRFSQATAIDFSGASLLRSIGVGAFSNSLLTAVDFTGLDRLRTIPNNAFLNALSLASVQNWAGAPLLTSIGSDAFRGTAISGNLDLSRNLLLRSIAGAAFEGTRLTSLTFPSASPAQSLKLDPYALNDVPLAGNLIFPASVAFAGTEPVLSNLISSNDNDDLTLTFEGQVFRANMVNGAPSLARVVVRGETNLASVTGPSFVNVPKLVEVVLYGQYTIHPDLFNGTPFQGLSGVKGPGRFVPGQSAPDALALSPAPPPPPSPPPYELRKLTVSYRVTGPDACNALEADRANSLARVCAAGDPR